MNLASLLIGARAWLRGTRCKWLLAMTALCLLLRENYPFSNFPMYSSFSHRTYYLYLTDERAEAIKTRQFGLSSSALKKIFDRFRRRELERFEGAGAERVPLAEKAAAESLLQYLDGLAVSQPGAPGLLAGLEVKHVRVTQSGTGLHLETRTLGRHR